MAAFPPVVQAKITDVPERGRPPVLQYKEDDIRDAFLERFPILYKLATNLSSTDDTKKTKAAGFPSLDTLVEKYKDYNKVHQDSEVAMERTAAWVLSEMQDAKIKKTWVKQVRNLKKQENDSDSERKLNTDESIDISQLFKLSKPGKSNV